MLDRLLSAQSVVQTRLDIMRKIKTAGVYTTDTSKLLGVFTSKGSAKEFANSYPKFTEIVFYYNLTPTQVEVLPYAQAYDFENKIETATNWRKIA